MKYVITEQQYKLIRRESDIKRRIDNLLLMTKHQNDLNYVPLLTGWRAGPAVR